MASQKKTKQKLGQFFTTNHKHILQDMKISPKIKNIIEPFCGDGDLVSFITSQTSQHSKAKIECYDIDPKKDFITKRDTIKNPPNYNGKYVITNPPYLARNKSDTKELFDQYDCNDLYKCFIKELCSNYCIGGIIIVPLNFWCSIRKNDIDLRRFFLKEYNVNLINIFEEKVFDDTSYTVCSFQFERREEEKNDEKEEKEENIININIYPSEKKIQTVLKDSNNYMIGGDIYHLKTKNYKITRLTSKNKDEKNTNILVKCIDDSEEKKICLSYVSDKDIYIDNTPKLSSRTYATLIIDPPINGEKQKWLVKSFNQFLNEYRTKYHSLFLANYRESKDIARKRISFDLVYQICSHLLE